MHAWPPWLPFGHIGCPDAARLIESGRPGHCAAPGAPQVPPVVPAEYLWYKDRYPATPGTPIVLGHRSHCPVRRPHGTTGPRAPGSWGALHRDHGPGWPGHRNLMGRTTRVESPGSREPGSFRNKAGLSTSLICTATSPVSQEGQALAGYSHGTVDKGCTPWSSGGQF